MYQDASSSLQEPEAYKLASQCYLTGSRGNIATDWFLLTSVESSADFSFLSVCNGSDKGVNFISKCFANKANMVHKYIPGYQKLHSTARGARRSCMGWIVSKTRVL